MGITSSRAIMPSAITSLANKTCTCAEENIWMGITENQIMDFATTGNMKACCLRTTRYPTHQIILTVPGANLMICRVNSHLCALSHLWYLRLELYVWTQVPRWVLNSECFHVPLLEALEKIAAYQQSACFFKMHIYNKMAKWVTSVYAQSEIPILFVLVHPVLGSYSIFSVLFK